MSFPSQLLVESLAYGALSLFLFWVAVRAVTRLLPQRPTDIMDPTRLKTFSCATSGSDICASNTTSLNRKSTESIKTGPPSETETLSAELATSKILREARGHERR